jgi:hypothetical protein
VAVRGYVDGVIAGEVVGWAFDDDRPSECVRVSGTIDGVELGKAIADQDRGDVRAAGLGNGLCGFRLPFTTPLGPGRHTVDVSVVGTGVALPLARDWVAHGDGDIPLDGVVLQGPGEPATGGRPDADRDPGPDVVALVGAGTWLFPVPSDGGDGPRGLARISHGALDADVDAVEAFHAAVAAARAVGCVVEVPDKLQVYAEHLPEGFTVDADGRWARRLQARLRDSDVGGVLDLYDVLTDARAHGRTFTRTGRGVSWVGAVHAARAIARAVGVRPRPLDAIDLGLLAPVEDSVVDAPRVTWRDGAFVPVPSTTLPEDEEPVLDLRPLPAGSATGLIVHDGCGGRIAQVVGERFARVTVVEAGAVTSALLKREKADVVVWIRGDRASPR